MMMMMRGRMPGIKRRRKKRRVKNAASARGGDFGNNNNSGAGSLSSPVHYCSRRGSEEREEGGEAPLGRHRPVYACTTDQGKVVIAVGRSNVRACVARRMRRRQ